MDDVPFKLNLEQRSDGVILAVRAHAGARRNAILGVREGALRVAVTAAPEKGKANRAIAELLAKTLGMSKSAIELVSGDTSPQKRFLIVDVSVDTIRTALNECV
ncbi:MAG TPA: DUF167 domain-containing protein [Lacipirellulaceae bacterium]|nr:DUF167 domain-containing protein [Lacipirellulaceae bacterium]